MGGAPVIRFRLPATAPPLPRGLARHVAGGELSLTSADVTEDLATLVEWARQNRVDLTAVTPLITSVSGANPVLVFTYIPLLIFSGAPGNLTLPHWVTTAASYPPVQPVVHSVTRALQHTGGVALVSPRDLAVLAGWTAGCLLLSMRLFSWDPHRPRTHPGPGANPASIAGPG